MTDRTPEAQRYDRACKRAEAALRKLARDPDHFWPAVRAVDRADDLTRWVEPEERERAAALRRQIAPAREAGEAVRASERTAELRRLREQEREARIVARENGWRS